LYENEDNPVLQSFSLIGRYHGQYWNVQADQGNDRNWENRRMIVGFSSRWHRHFTIQAQMYIKSGESHYDGLYEAYVAWSPSRSDFSLNIGRLDYLYTGMERSRSSKKINTIERGLLVNQVMPAEVVGIHAKGRSGAFSYQAGLFSGGIEEEFDDFNNGSAFVLGAGYDAPLFFDEGTLHLDYLNNGSDPEGNAFRPYKHIVSLWHEASSGRLGMGIDLTIALPRDTPGRIWGLTLEPTWDLMNGLFSTSDSLQLAFRYQFSESSAPNGLRLQRRYEEKVTQGFGDRYHALYAGLNYFIYGHKLKLMLGGEYAHMRDQADDDGQYRGWTWFGAVRTYF
jgi:phosphate-selective porin OprO/OprP